MDWIIYVCPADSCWNLHTSIHIHTDHWITSDMICSNVLHKLQLFWFLIPICFSYYVQSPSFVLMLFIVPHAFSCLFIVFPFIHPISNLFPYSILIFHTVPYTSYVFRPFLQICLFPTYINTPMFCLHYGFAPFMVLFAIHLHIPRVGCSCSLSPVQMSKLILKVCHVFRLCLDFWEFMMAIGHWCWLQTQGLKTWDTSM